MKTVIKERIQRLRTIMKQLDIQASIIPSSDPHQSEYLAECWKYREYMSGFTGSAGTLVVGLDKAGLWTDSRYFLQADSELQGSDIQLFKSAIPGTPALEQWIADQGYTSVGIDGSMFSTKEALRLSEYFAKGNIRLEANFKPYSDVWPDRPKLPQGKLFVFPESFSGESVESKIHRVREQVRLAGADGLPVAALDEIAWLFNFRGSDVDFNPVAISYAYIGQDKSIFFVEPEKLTPEVISYLKNNHVEISGYDDFTTFISCLTNTCIFFDKAANNYDLFRNIPDSCTIKEGMSPVNILKARKNPTEIVGFREAMIKDGVALVKFMIWLESETSGKNPEGHLFPDEWTIGEKVATFRKEQENYLTESFGPIAGFRDHGAIVHYEAEPAGSSTVSGEGVLLMDLGAHYLNGSTDITRTVYLNGEPPLNYKEDYSCLLKGVIALSNASFPEGTRGTQLDVLARQFLWQRSLNFLHGTGHGVGHCLYVHEGPQSIRMNENPVTLEPGMVTSNEPGLYRAGEYGVRIENLILVYEKETTPLGKFYAFETLTLFPFDLSSIDLNFMTQDEINWINNYHQNVFNKLSPRLDESEKAWLGNKTRRIVKRACLY